MSLEDPPPVSGRRRIWPWLLGGLLLVIVVTAGFTLNAARIIKTGASSAQASLQTAKDDLSNGDLPGARTAVAQATASVADAQAATQAWPLRVAGSLPWVSTPVQDVDRLVTAADGLVTASGSLVDVYATATGKTGGKKLFADSTVDLAQLAPLGAQMTAVNAQLGTAIDQLHQVQGTFPGTGALADARDSALAEAVPLQTTFTRVQPLLLLLPEALGATTPHRYLLAVLNVAELRASGGAPLSVALLTVDKGHIVITERGQTSSEIIPGNPLVPWQHVTAAPFPAGDQPARFVSSNVHPDFRKAGEEMTRGWAASGKPPVDGVVTIDPVALAAVLRATGPVNSVGYGEVTADNLASTLLVDAYRKYDSRGQRQSLNDQLATAMIERITKGDKLLATLRALASEAPGRHLQIHMQQPELQSLAESAGFAGMLDEKAVDPIAVFTQNTNSSKADVFQQRDISQQVTMRDDGGAEVVRTVTLHNDTPPGAGNGKVAGYTTAYAGSAVMIYAPRSGTGLAVTGEKNPGKAWFDGLGGLFYRTAGVIDPGGTWTLTMRYSLPAGTYPDGVYRGVVEPQPTLNNAHVTVSVTGADGTEAPPVDLTVTGPVSVAVPTR